MSKFSAILRLTRIEHSVMLVIAVIAAEILAGGLPAAGIFILSMITPVFTNMASFAINDYFDIKVDRLNRRMDRPLVNGSLRPKDARNVTIACFAIGMGASLFINQIAFSIAVAFSLLAILYSYRMKETLFLGNAYIALAMVIPFVYGNYVVSSSLRASVVLISAMIFFSGLAREIHGTIRDFRGDVKARNMMTIPRVIGVKHAAWIAFYLYAVAIAISIYIFLTTVPFMLNRIFLVGILVSDLMLLYVSSGFVISRSSRFYAKTRNISLFAMGLALVTIALSAAFYI